MLPAWGRAGNHPCAKERKAVQHAKAHQQAQREVLIEAKHPNMPCGPPMSYVDAKCCEVSCYVQLKGERRVYDFAQFQKEFRKHAKIFSAQESPGPRSCLSCSDRHPVRVGVRTKRIFSAKKICFSLCSLYFHISKADGCASVCSSALAAAP